MSMDERSATMFSSNAHGDQSYPAVVTKTDDPERRGRLKVTCSALLGDENREYQAWVEPDLPWGWFLIPDVGQQVTLTISLGSSGDVFSGQSSIASSRPRWSGGHFTTSGPESALVKDPTPVGGEFTATNYGKRRGFKTPRGHVFMFDDSTGFEQITLSWAGGTLVNPKAAFLAIDPDGSFVVQDSGGSVLYMNAGGDSTLINKHGGYLLMNDQGISLVDQNNNALIMNAQGISMVSGGPIAFAGTDHVFQSGLHFIDNGITVNVGGIAASFHPLTVSGIAMLVTTAGALAVPGDPTWDAHLAAFGITAGL